jgi:hypothetical protein
MNVVMLSVTLIIVISPSITMKNVIVSITSFATVVLGVMIILSVANKLSMLSVMVLWQVAGGLFQIRIQSTVLA